MFSFRSLCRVIEPAACTRLHPVISFSHLNIHNMASSSKGRGKGRGQGRRNEDPDVQLSKTLSWILRHGAKGEGLEMRSDGYVKLDDLVCPVLTL